MRALAQTAQAGVSCRFNPTTGCLILSGETGSVQLPPLWLRERSEAPDQLDHASHQRYFDPTRLPADLTITDAQPSVEGVTLSFSDGHCWSFDPTTLGIEAGLLPDPLALPAPEAWTAADMELPIAEWQSLDDPLMLRGTPTEEDSLLDIARRFGPIRETNWGRLFNVRTEAAATDLAYTGRALTAHTDNPYRRSVPGIQFLHCLMNEATGGESTVVDGLAIAEALKAASPELYRVG
jgi:gamma-butyrobetaine dioxygenase